ncbi:VTT domain-containing protein [Haloferula sp.]|uniref:VTT domain-containing protein n=1 Tax=Haloferula sp. TaxID=2497595 RepID=UPI003C787687
MSCSPEPSFKPGDNCWRVTRASKGAFLLSGQDYFSAFRESVLLAEREVLLLAWDISGSIEMIRTPEDDDGYPSCLADFLIAVLDEKPDLEIRILLWDYSVVYLAEREWLPFTRWKEPGHPRLHFETDDAIAVGASHHQKLVVVDGVLAFCGGIDLSAWRWDRPEHRAEDEKRRNPQGSPYQPYHDIQLVLTGPVVGDLRDLVMMRWKRATGEEISDLRSSRKDVPWPESVSVDFEDEELALALTFAQYEDYPPSRHIEQLHLDLIASAGRYLYIENQYLSSHTIVEALADRLREVDGPEVVLVLTREAGGWAEEGTLGLLRDRLLEILADADLHERLTSCYPHAEDGDGSASQVYVHAKLLIADDRMFLTGSANLSNRSMKVDSEVDVAVLHDEPVDFIRALLDRLLAMHFQMEPSTVRDRIEASGSIGAAIKELRDSGGNRLRILEGGCNSVLQRKLADSQLLDPDEPISPAHHVRKALKAENLVPELSDSDDSSPVPLRVLKVVGWIAGLALLGLALNRLSGTLIDQDRVTRFLAPLEDSPFAIPLLILVFAVAGVLAVPINLIIIGATIVLGPWYAFGCGFGGTMLAAALSHAIGHHVGKPVVARFAGDKLEALSAALANRGIWSVALIRVLPVAPFGVVNLVAGISSIRFSVFMIGSAIGLLPGVAAVTLATRRFVMAIEDPGLGNWLWFAAFLAVIAGVSWWLKKRFT